MPFMVGTESKLGKNSINYDNDGADGGDKVMEGSKGIGRRWQLQNMFNFSETVEHLVTGCTKLANSEYLNRHNRALMVLVVTWAKQQELIGQDAIWYEQRCDRGTVFENHKAKLVWDFEFHLQKTTTARRPDLFLELKEDKKIWICDMACPQQNNIETKRIEKMTKYRQLAFETRERWPSYDVYVLPVVIGG